MIKLFYCLGKCTWLGTLCSSILISMQFFSNFLPSIMHVYSFFFLNLLLFCILLSIVLTFSFPHPRLHAFERKRWWNFLILSLYFRIAFNYHWFILCRYCASASIQTPTWFLIELMIHVQVRLFHMLQDFNTM